MLVVISKRELLDSGVKPNQIISINFEDLEYEALQHVPQFEKVVGSLFIKP